MYIHFLYPSVFLHSGRQSRTKHWTLSARAFHGAIECRLPYQTTFSPTQSWIPPTISISPLVDSAKSEEKERPTYRFQRKLKGSLSPRSLSWSNGDHQASNLGPVRSFQALIAQQFLLEFCCVRARNERPRG